MKISHSERARRKRIQDSVNEHNKRKEHYANFLKKRAFNIKNRIAPEGILMDKRGYRL